MFAAGRGGDLLDLDASGDDHVSQSGHNLRKGGEPGGCLVCDQDTKLSILVVRLAHPGAVIAKRPGHLTLSVGGLDPWLPP